MIYPSIQIIVIGLLCMLSIILYGTYRCKNTEFKDPFTQSFVPPPWDKFLDGWGILHFLFYMILAYFYPTHLLLIFMMGVGWEILESYFYDHPFYLSKCNYNLSTDGVAGWWYGRWQDIVMNSLGIIVGYYLAKLNF
jgi:hypothetical protein